MKKPEDARETALGFLLGVRRHRLQHGAPAVRPVRINPAQRRTLHAATREPLTVVTGPPGTGKSQLIVDVVATALAAGLTVLVTTTNNQALDDVCERLDDKVPGVFVRVGSKKRGEGQALRGLRHLAEAAGRADGSTTVHRCEQSSRTLARRREELERIGTGEQTLNTAVRRERAVEGELGLDPGWEPATDLGRARGRAGARWFFPNRRRARFLARAGLPSWSDSAASCRALADLAAARIARTSAREKVADADDDDLWSALDAAIVGVETASTDFLAQRVGAHALDGRHAIDDLLGTIESRTPSQSHTSEPWNLRGMARRERHRPASAQRLRRGCASGRRGAPPRRALPLPPDHRALRQ